MTQSDPPRTLEGLDDLRAKLDELDHGILTALIERDRIVAEVADRKSQKGDAKVRDPVREEAQLSRLTGEGQAAGLDGFYVGRVFREVLDHSVRIQQEFLARIADGSRVETGELVISYQGIDGAYSHLAAMRHFGPRGGNVVFRGYPSFRAMMEAVRDGHAHYGVLPIENTTAGSINDAYDLLAQMDLSIVGEEVQKVEHCLVAIDPVPVSQIRRVFSHPQALAQCSNFLSSLTDCHVEAFTDTAMAVQRVGREQDLTQAAIASEDAARRYGLTVIKREIANQKENYTRMVVVAARPEKVDLRIAAKTSLVLAMKHERGALLSCLTALAQRGLNMTKLESRPRLHTPWEYLFYLDFEGNVEDQAVSDALQELRTQTSFLRVLGSYPARRNPDSKTLSVPAVLPTPEQSAAPVAIAPARVTARATTVRPSSRQFRRDDTVIAIGRAVLGGSAPVFIASVGEHDKREALLDSARALALAGAHAIRVENPSLLFGGTLSPYAEEALISLEEIAKLTGLAIALEVTDPAQIDRLARRADLLVIPALHMHNEVLLREAGRLDRPVMLERSSMASIDEWLAAADRILERGNHRVALCERGIRTFEESTPSTLDLAAVPVLRELSHLPVLVDSTRAAGHARWAVPLADAALAAGAQGLSLAVKLGLRQGDDAIEVTDFARLVARASGCR
ncbi:MAG: phospho-2-dehydro-3-deoxyheptonate aldolase [Myxococcaceae bacterium]|nr:phospho-2-dehydro-3-deoxyheptonate aldolase [Myxococcaceae bacterium]